MYRHGSSKIPTAYRSKGKTLPNNYTEFLTIGINLKGGKLPFVHHIL